LTTLFVSKIVPLDFFFLLHLMRHLYDFSFFPNISAFMKKNFRFHPFRVIFKSSARQPGKKIALIFVK